MKVLVEVETLENQFSEVTDRLLQSMQSNTNTPVLPTRREELHTSTHTDHADGLFPEMHWSSMGQQVSHRKLAHTHSTTTCVRIGSLMSGRTRKHIASKMNTLKQLSTSLCNRGMTAIHWQFQSAS